MKDESELMEEMARIGIGTEVFRSDDPVGLLNYLVAFHAVALKVSRAMLDEIVNQQVMQ